jgi:hypothetical protein
MGDDAPSPATDRGSRTAAIFIRCCASRAPQPIDVCQRLPKEWAHAAPDLRLISPSIPLGCRVRAATRCRALANIGFERCRLVIGPYAEIDGLYLVFRPNDPARG